MILLWFKFVYAHIIGLLDVGQELSVDNLLNFFSIFQFLESVDSLAKSGIGGHVDEEIIFGEVVCQIFSFFVCYCIVSSKDGFILAVLLKMLCNQTVGQQHEFFNKLLRFHFRLFLEC